MSTYQYFTHLFKANVYLYRPKYLEEFFLRSSPIIVMPDSIKAKDFCSFHPNARRTLDVIFCIRRSSKMNLPVAGDSA